MQPETNHRYIETVGRRKTSVARVRITPQAKNSFVINDKNLNIYFPTDELRMVAVESLDKAKITQKFKITVVVKGGGVHSQAEAVRHGIARGLIDYDKELRKDIKKLGFLKRDPRAKERRKFGLKKARKAPQWSKR
ncbi:MAG: 30S ribosomal protein S9 [Patescibacteria group bacterium]|nr:30S ribosomal protein S9 [Patescibacteria group bacterium]